MRWGKKAGAGSTAVRRTQLSDVSLIRFKRFTYRVKVLAPGAEVTAEAAPDQDVQQFREAWREMQRDYRAPVSDWSARDAVIIGRLLSRHPLDTLRTMAVDFWRRAARDMGVFDGRGADQIVLFAAAIKQERL